MVYHQWNCHLKKEHEVVTSYLSLTDIHLIEEQLLRNTVFSIFVQLLGTTLLCQFLRDRCLHWKQWIKLLWCSAMWDYCLYATYLKCWLINFKSLANPLMINGNPLVWFICLHKLIVKKACTMGLYPWINLWSCVCKLLSLVDGMGSVDRIYWLVTAFFAETE